MPNIGVDFGGTRIKAAWVEGGQPRQSAVRATPAGAPWNVVLDAVAQAVTELNVADSRIGVAIPGQVDPLGQCIRLPNVPGFEGVPIAQELSARLQRSVVVENDGTAAALGERLYGHGRRYPSFLLCTLGTGIGGGLCIQGRVQRGAHGFAAEIGHILIDTLPSARPCGCGKRGCVEAYAGTQGLLARFAELGGRATEVREIAASASAGQKAGSEVFNTMGNALGIALAQVQKVVDLDAFVFSGGISAAFDRIRPSLLDALRAHVHGRATAEVPLLVSQLGEHAGVIGASELPDMTFDV